ncbi:uromodulin-like isoform X1 [Rhinatrema bivittatum]|uniref:uromodulin-like isoform X1 n=1 Tax=Rhinatrema bivittatum TaxID=194408 RepID=UPI001129F56F|nr:uromodulin-like isoform X1 [Rhinatrema bivittatum]
MLILSASVLLLHLLQTVSAGCPPCASDEVCNNVTSSCDCNLTLYTAPELPPTPIIQCLSGKISLSVSRCQLEKSGYNSTGLHLLEPSCTGAREIINNQAEIVLTANATTGACGNLVMLNNSHEIISNVLSIPAGVLWNGIIVNNNVNLNFSCVYPLSMQLTLNTAIRPVLSAANVTVPEATGNLATEMYVFKDQDYLQSSDTFIVNDSLNVTVLKPSTSAP